MNLLSYMSSHTGYKRITLLIKSCINVVIVWLCVCNIHNTVFAIIGSCCVILILIISRIIGIYPYNEILNARSVLYIYRIIQDIIRSAIYLIKIIYDKTDKQFISGIITTDISSLNKQQKIMLANAITMTPGTFVIALNEDRLVIHTIDKKSAFSNNKEILTLIGKVKIT